MSVESAREAWEQADKHQRTIGQQRDSAARMLARFIGADEELRASLYETGPIRHYLDEFERTQIEWEAAEAARIARYDEWTHERGAK